MTSKIKYRQPSPETVEESMKIARATQRPGQTKEQTKLIAQGIQKGIDIYKKQQKVKQREIDKRRKKDSTAIENAVHADEGDLIEAAHADDLLRRPWLPWLLLLLTWAGIGTYFLLK